MSKQKTAIILALVAITAIFTALSPAAGEHFAGQDLHFFAGSVTVYEDVGGNGQVLIFGGHFTMKIGANSLSSERAMVWLKPITSEYRGGQEVNYSVDAYLEGDISVTRGKAARTSGLSEATVEEGQALAATFFVSGEVFVTADEQTDGKTSALKDEQIYQSAIALIQPADEGFVIAPQARVPGLVEVEAGGRPLQVSDFFGVREKERGEFAGDGVVTGKPGAASGAPLRKEPKFRYPINIAGVWEEAPELIKTRMPDRSQVATLTGRFYLWQKKNEKGDLLEFQADSAVLFYGDEQPGADTEKNDEGFTGVKSAYFQGNIVMVEGERTIRADELYYDFENTQALVVNAEMRTFDKTRGIPIYLRAVKLRKVTENVFEAENVTLTASEFYLPQISMTASKMVLTDLTGVDERAGKEVDDSKYDGIFTDIKLKVGRRKIFGWPRIRTNFERPDTPIKRARIGRDSDFGTTVETEWYLSKLLGLKEPPGTDATLNLDYYSKRGPGAGFTVDYEREDYYGGVSAYVVKDRGEDDLGRIDDRKDLDSGEEYRGRFTAQHRHYLPYDWQATTEFSYISDEHFLESFYRNEFNTAKAQETLLHLKRLKDNWAFSFLTKVRVNDFKTVTEELPTIGFHVKGQSLWDHRLTYYTDSQVSRFRDKISQTNDSKQRSSYAAAQGQFYTFAFTRHEIDMPLRFDKVKVVPFVAGSYAFEDKTGYDTRLNQSTAPLEDEVFLGETGVRVATMFWKDNPSIKSEFWDIDGIRHIVKPHTEAILYKSSDETIEMRDMFNVGVSQRWQTRRGPKEDKRTLDWMRLDVDATLLRDAEDSAEPTTAFGPSKFIWNNPAIDFLTRRDTARFGLLRNSINADYFWRVTDTTTVLSDLNYDIRSGVLQQLDLGFTRYVYPDISYYIGSRYLRSALVSIPSEGVYEQGSHSLVGSIAYNLNDRYIVTFSQEYNFDYARNVKSELALLRRYHRLYYGFTFGVDESMGSSWFTFSVWPQGVKGLAFGKRKYVSLSERILED